MIISSLSHARGVLSEARFWHCPNYQYYATVGVEPCA